MITLDDVKLFNLRNFIEPDGNLVPIESKHDIPFDMKRIFYVYGVDNQDDRGKHSHYKTKQVLICLNGEVKVVCDDGKNRQSYTLSKPNQALYIPEMIWDEQIYMSRDSVLLVLANTPYDELDYIQYYEQFVKLKNESK